MLDTLPVINLAYAKNQEYVRILHQCQVLHLVTIVYRFPPLFTRKKKIVISAHQVKG